jgi:O-antigen ligase
MGVDVRYARRHAGSELKLAPAVLAACAVALGVVYAFTANQVSPWALPEWLAIIFTVVVSYRRPEIGVAATLVVIPAGTLGFDSHLAAYIASGLAVYVAVIAYCRRERDFQSQRLAAIALAVLFFLCATLVSLTQSPDLTTAGRPLRALILGSILFAATLWSVRDRQSLTWVLRGMSAGALLVGVHAVREYLSGGPATSGFITTSGELVGRVTAGFGQANQLGGFLEIAVPLAVAGAALDRRLRPIFVATALVAAFGAYVSFSRGALIGLALVPFVFLRDWRLWLGGPLLALILVLAAPGLVKERFATLTTSGPDVATRADIWRAAVNVWEAHPVFGAGLGEFPRSYSQINLPGKQYLPNTIFQPPPHAHNLLLQVLSEQGILGLLAFVPIFWLAFRASIRLRAGPNRTAGLVGSALLAALLAFLAHNLFDVTLEEPHTGPYVLVLLGLIGAAAGIAWKPDGPMPRSRLRGPA